MSRDTHDNFPRLFEALCDHEMGPNDITKSSGRICSSVSFSRYLFREHILGDISQMCRPAIDS